MKFSVIIPMYNEKANATNCASELTKTLEKAAEALSFEYEIIFSDDGSRDGCGDLVREWICKNELNYGKVTVYTAEKNSGKGMAVRLGMMQSTGDYTLFTDCDRAYGCDVIVEMLKHVLDKKTDIVIGSRAIGKDGYSGYTFMRKLASKTYMKTLSLVAGFRHSDSQCGIKLFSGEVARRVFPLCEVCGWAFDLEVLMIAEKMGYTVSEYPVQVINHGESKVNLVKDSLKMLKDIKKIKKRVKSLEI